MKRLWFLGIALVLLLLASCGGGGGGGGPIQPPPNGGGGGDGGGGQTAFRIISVTMPTEFVDSDTGEVVTMRFRYWLDYSLKLDIMPGQTGTCVISCDRSHTVKMRFDILTRDGVPVEDPRPGVDYVEIGPESGRWFEPGTTIITEDDWPTN